MTVSLILFIFGLAIGSFLNVASTRYSETSPRFFKTLGGRSHCPLCGATLNWYELIPVFSFIAQLGKCRHCHGRISWQYLIVELSTALVFVGLGNIFQNNYLDLAIWLVAASVLIFIAAVDWRLFIIPDGANIFLALLGAALMLKNGAYASHITSAVVALFFFGAVVLITRGKGMGVGDVKLAGALGLLLGWPAAFIAFLSSFVIGAIYGVALILARKKTMKDAVPFGPFLVIGTFISLFFSKAIFDIINL